MPFIAFLLVAVLLLAVDEPTAKPTRPAVETQKIEALLKQIQDLRDAKFIRNGSEYDAKTAAKFLRQKWESRDGEILSAKDFVSKVASISSTSGNPYIIRMTGDREIECGAFLLAELDKLERPAVARVFEVNALLAAAVQFDGVARDSVAAAGLELLESSSCPEGVTEEDWAEAQRRCHLAIRFAEPRSALVNRTNKLLVDELLIPFPLTATGRLFVRSDGKLVGYAKYSQALSGKMQSLLKDAQPIR
ncbi:MAG: DUF5329 family protein [Planctomycetota bacterium]